ncbi:MAG TPA: hypothetical protein DHU75_03790 [Rikenellaceae bacterium]|nr:hypothetical protein [Rikenellaceae bacterium]
MMGRSFFMNLVICATVVWALGCSKEGIQGKDMEKPQILDGDIPSPIDCEVYYIGDEIPFRYTFTDNDALGNFNIEIHNNFDHHTHSTSAGDCPLDPKKDPVNPWIYNQDFSIPSGLKTFEAKVDIPIPAGIDTGDYHFMIRLTDKTGWQQLKAISFKIRDGKNEGN